jgi:putative membrane protein insertion efficiency factor
MTLSSRLAPAAPNRQFPGRMLFLLLPSLLLRGLIRFYQLTLAYFFVGACRFEPSCSAYAAEAVARHGALKGSFLAAHRFCRCGPWTTAGYDPVPPVSSRSCHSAERL